VARELGAPALAATSQAADGGCAGQGHDSGNAPWRPGDDKGKQRWCVASFHGGRQAPTAGDVFSEAL
jgi:hypothetical protein